MTDSYSDKDQPPAVSASTPGGSGSEEEEGTMKILECRDKSCQLVRG